MGPTQHSSGSIEDDAELIYEYHRMHMDLPKVVDAIFCLCSLDVRVAERAAQLFLDGYGKHLIFSGGSGKLTENRFDEPEAQVFARRACALGVPPDKIWIEPLSTNTGENVRFTWKLAEARGEKLSSFILVQKPYMERRTFATFKKQWPDENASITVTSPQIEWRDYPNDDNPKELVVNIMVGDLVRVKEYPAKGFQIPQDIPQHVWDAGQKLIAAGYDKHLP